MTFTRAASRHRIGTASEINFVAQAIRRKMRGHRATLARLVPLAALASVGILFALYAMIAPSHDRAWRPEQAVLPEVSLDGRLVRIRNVRDFEYRSETDFDRRYRDATYDLEAIQRVWMVLSPFSRDWRGPAHIFLSFEFADSQFVSVSVEARREHDEEYSIWRGVLRRFELMYVIGEERDLIGSRAAIWEDAVYVYPMRATPDQARKLFLGMIERARSLESRPEFYNTLTNNCTTNILELVNQIATEPIPYGISILLPGYSDRLVHERGLIDTDLSLEDARRTFQVDDRARAALHAPDFSRRIRG